MKKADTMLSARIAKDDIAFCISAVCSKLLGRSVKCRIYCDDNEYWGAISEDSKFTIKEILDLLVAINANADICRETMPTEETTTSSLSMDLSSGLLKLALGTDWIWEHILDHSLLLIGLSNEGIGIPTHEDEISAGSAYKSMTSGSHQLLPQQLV